MNAKKLHGLMHLPVIEFFLHQIFLWKSSLQLTSEEMLWVSWGILAKKGRKSSSAVVSLSDKVQNKINSTEKGLEQLGRRWIHTLRLQWLFVDIFEDVMSWFHQPYLCFLPGRWFFHLALRPRKHQHLDCYQRHQIHQGVPPKQRSDPTSLNSSERT